jgi:hypothetical protein
LQKLAEVRLGLENTANLERNAVKREMPFWHYESPALTAELQARKKNVPLAIEV